MNSKDSIKKNATLQTAWPYFEAMQQIADSYFLICEANQDNAALVSESLAHDFGFKSLVVEHMQEVWGSRIHEDDRETYWNFIRTIFDDHQVPDKHIEYRARDKDGVYVWLSVRASIITDINNEPWLHVVSFSRMARKHDADDITGLLNRFAFERHLDRVLAEPDASGAVIILGLDEFRSFYETYGRQEGDDTLREIAMNFEHLLPPGLNLYKLDGEQFGIIWPGVSPAEAEIIVSSAQISLQEAKASNSKIFSTVSAGAVFYPEGGKDAQTLQKHAESALEMAHQQGRDRMYVFSQEDYDKWLRFIELQSAFQSSIEHGCSGFLLYYQPQVDAATHQVIGAEALLRWQDKDGNIISPAEFIPVLEQTRFIIPVGFWIAEEAIKTCKKWQKVIPNFQMSINVSLYQLENFNFEERIDQLLKEYELDPHSFVVELTEGQRVKNWSFVNEQFKDFRKNGVKVALDGFGVAYSSLALLKFFKCDIVKIGRLLVKDVMESDFDRNLAKYSIRLCRSIGMKVCVEGVEEEKVATFLDRVCGADFLQGYYFGHPVPEEAFEAQFLKR